MLMLLLLFFFFFFKPQYFGHLASPKDRSAVSHPASAEHAFGSDVVKICELDFEYGLRGAAVRVPGRQAAASLAAYCSLG